MIRDFVERGRGVGFSPARGIVGPGEAPWARPAEGAWAGLTGSSRAGSVPPPDVTEYDARPASPSRWALALLAIGIGVLFVLDPLDGFGATTFSGRAPGSPDGSRTLAPEDRPDALASLAPATREAVPAWHDKGGRDLVDRFWGILDLRLGCE